MSPPQRPMPALLPARSARAQRRALRGAAWTGDPKASAARPEHRHQERVQLVQRHRYLHPGPTRRALEWPAARLGCRVGVVELVAGPQRGRTAVVVAASAVVPQRLWSPRSWRVRTLRLASTARPRRQRDSRCSAHSASTANPTGPTADSSASQRDPARLGRKCWAHSARTTDRRLSAVRGLAHLVPVTQGWVMGHRDGPLPVPFRVLRLLEVGRGELSRSEVPRRDGPLPVRFRVLRLQVVVRT